MPVEELSFSAPIILVNTSVELEEETAEASTTAGCVSAEWLIVVLMLMMFCDVEKLAGVLKTVSEIVVV